MLLQHILHMRSQCSLEMTHHQSRIKLIRFGESTVNSSSHHTLTIMLVHVLGFFRVPISTCDHLFSTFPHKMKICRNPEIWSQWESGLKGGHLYQFCRGILTTDNADITDSISILILKLNRLHFAQRTGV